MGYPLVPIRQVLLNKRNILQDLALGLLDSDKILLQPSVIQEKSVACHDKTPILYFSNTENRFEAASELASFN